MNINDVVARALADRNRLNNSLAPMKYAFKADANVSMVYLIGKPFHNSFSEKQTITIRYYVENNSIQTAKNYSL